MNTSDPNVRQAPQHAAGDPPAERRFARRIDCAPRLSAAAPPPPAAPVSPPPPRS